jgi:hypothetical protein
LEYAGVVVSNVGSLLGVAYLVNSVAGIIPAAFVATGMAVRVASASAIAAAASFAGAM